MIPLQLNLIIYAICYLSIIFFWRTLKIKKRIKASPIKYTSVDTAHNYIGKLFLILLVSHIITAIYYIFFYKSSFEISFLDNSFIHISGVLLGWFSLFWVFIAQHQMGDNWRIGIDKNKKIYILTKGLFSFNRHPIYLGVMLTSFSLFLIMTNIINLFLFVITYILLNIQARLEEEYLSNIKEYRNYKKKIPRRL